MNDPIKDFVEEHRAEFDHLEAPVFKMDQLRPKIQDVPELRKKNFTITSVNKWLVAATVLMAMTCVWLFFYNNNTGHQSVQIVNQKPAKNDNHASTADSVSNALPNTATPTVQLVTATRDQKILKAAPDNKVIKELYANLRDSTSASSRLMAILEMEKTGRVDDHVMDMLAATLNHDGNTNVRLAALSLMEKYSDDGHVSALLVSSLNKQNDPIVQLGLVSLLGKKKNLKIDDKLKSLADGPDTFAAVRDEAYSILLNQNKL